MYDAYDYLFPFWAFGVIIPFIVSQMILTTRTNSDEHDLLIMAVILTLKPVVFGLIGFFVLPLAPLMPIAGFLTSLSITIFYSPMLFNHRKRREAWILVALDWVRLLYSGWLTYTFSVGTYSNPTPDYFLEIAFFVPTIFAIIALVIARLEARQYKSKRVEGSQKDSTSEIQSLNTTNGKLARYIAYMKMNSSR